MAKTPEEKYNYVLDYIEEAIRSREGLRNIISQTVRAYQGNASRNYYLERVERYRGYLQQHEPEKVAMFERYYSTVQAEKNFTIFDAVETNTSMIMGGAGQFEYEPYDEFLEKDAETIDRMRSLAQFFHTDNKIDATSGPMARKLNMQGAAYYYIRHQENKNRFKVDLIDAWRMLLDPYRFKSNRSRYMGFSQVESWRDIKEYVRKEKKGTFLKSINRVDSYIEEVRARLSNVNKDVWEFDNILDNHLNIFYGPEKARAEASSNTKPGDDPTAKYTYHGDDVEVSYLWDLETNTYFVVVNRWFIVKAEANSMRKSVKTQYYDSEGKKKDHEVIVEVDCPLVEIPYIKAEWSTYPISPLFYLLDDFDKLVSSETLREHNLSVMGAITFVGQSYDAEKLAALNSIAGEILEGTMNQVGVLSKTHDMTPVEMSIKKREERIKKVMRATDQFELQAMLGNRATASEVGSANGAVSQGLNGVIANIEAGMSELAQKLFDMYIIFSKDETVVFPHKGSYAELSKDDMMGRSLIRARLKSSVKLEQQMQSQQAQQVFLGMVAQDYVNKKELVGTFVPIITQGLVSRRQAEKLVADEMRVDATMLKLVSDAMDKNKNNEEQPDEFDNLDLEGIDPALLDQAMMELSGGVPMPMEGGMDPNALPVEDPMTAGDPAAVVDPMAMDPTMAPMDGATPVSTADPNMPIMAPGTAPADAGIIANQPGAF